MRNLTTTLGLCLVFTAFGCGDDGGSSIEGSKMISTLSDAELMAVCEDARAEYGERTVNCGDNVMITVGIEADECSMNMFLDKVGCEATVAQVLECARAFDAQTDQQICTSTMPPAGCAQAVIQCFPSEDG